MNIYIIDVGTIYYIDSQKAENKRLDNGLLDSDINRSKKG